MSHISLGVVGISFSYPKGGFVGNYYEDGQARKSKTISLAVSEPEIAFETVDLWAEDKSKETGVPYTKTSFKELQKRLIDNSTGTLKRGSKVTSPSIKSNLGNIKFFKMEMRRAFKEFGADKIREVLKEGTKLLGELQREKLRVQRNSGQAKTNIARAMYQTWVDTGVDTTIYCNDDEIINEFKKLQLENKKLLSQQGEINI